MAVEHKPDEDGYCVASDLPAEQCAGCLGHGEGVDDWSAVNVTTTMPARYASQLACGHTPETGETICKTKEGWICVPCSLGQ